MKKAIFIDRDGTLIEETGYLKMLQDIRFTSKALQALQIFSELGYLNIVITNQSAIARGILSPKELHKIHLRLRSLAKQEGARIDDIFICPHMPPPGGRVAPYNVECDCRKPKPGLLLQAKEKHGLDLEHSFVVGDKSTDLDLARSAGTKAALVLTGYGATTQLEWKDQVEVYSHLHEFACRLAEKNVSV